MKIKEIIPPTNQRVELHTARKISRQIEQKTLANLRKYRHASYEEITLRLKELDREWDTERVIEANDGFLILLSTIQGAASRKPFWSVLTGVTAFFLAQHAFQGWCLLIPLIRRMGIRTPEEINREKMALKYLRGDFSSGTDNIEAIFRMVAQV